MQRRRRSQGHLQFLSMSTEGKDSAPNATEEGGEFWRTSSSSWDLLAAEVVWLGLHRPAEPPWGTTGVSWPCVSLGSGLLSSRAGPGPWWEPWASNIAGAPGAQGCLSRTLAEIRRALLPKSTTTPRTLPSACLVSVTPPGSHRVPGPPQVLGCVPISGSIPARADATSLSPTLPAPKSLVLVQSHWLPVRSRTTWTGR